MLPLYRPALNAIRAETRLQHAEKGQHVRRATSQQRIGAAIDRTFTKPPGLSLVVLKESLYLM